MLSQRMYLWTSALLVLFLSACTEPATTSNLTGALKYDEIHYTKTENKNGEPCSEQERAFCAMIDLSYPDFTIAPNIKLKDKLNSLVHELLLSSEFETLDVKPENTEQLAFLYLQEFRESHSAADWELTHHINVLTTHPQFISLESQKAGYLGGAHGFQKVKLFNFDNNGEAIKLSNLLNLGYAGELNAIAEGLFRKQHQIPAEKNLEDLGFSFPNGEFQLNENFAITEQGLRFFFNAYEIAPYAFGTSDLLINYNEIQSLIKPDGLLARYQQQHRAQDNNDKHKSD
ncbi:MAG TPA: DUF3298 domain-containing protein [Thiothrix sp.]|nr:DUF3298 domain-containing protein [Thiothrix sp.]